MYLDTDHLQSIACKVCFCIFMIALILALILFANPQWRARCLQTSSKEIVLICTPLEAEGEYRCRQK